MLTLELAATCQFMILQINFFGKQRTICYKILIDFKRKKKNIIVILRNSILILKNIKLILVDNLIG